MTDPYRNGNLMQDRRWDSTKPGSATPPSPAGFNSTNAVIFQRVYDPYGNLTEVYEPEVRTTLTYGTTCNGLGSLYPTQIQQAPTLPEQRTFTYAWNCNTPVGPADPGE